MAIAFRSSSQAVIDNAASVTVAKPTGVAFGDVLVAVMFANGDPVDMAPPVGWLEAGSGGVQPSVINGKTWYRVVDNTADGADYTFTQTAASSSSIVVSAFTGVDHMLPVPLVQWDGSAINTTAHVAPSITPTALNSMLLCGWGGTDGGTVTYTPPAGMTEAGDSTSSLVFGSVAYQQLTGEGASSTRTATASASKPYLSVSLTLTPSGPTPGNYEEIVSWIDPAGGSTLLEVEWNLSGRFAPPPAFEEYAVPGESGLRLRDVRHKEREFTIPIWMTAPSEADLRTRLRDLVSAMNPLNGDGRIRVISPVGDQREIVCRYAAGLEVSESLGETSGIHAQKAAVVFRAHDPYWQDANDIVVEYNTGEQPAFFPILPVHLTSSEVFVASTIVNDGDVETWPLWTLQSPGQGIVLRNITTGKKLELSTVLSEGEELTIDTRPGKKLVTKGDGESLFPDLTNDSALWPLAVGNNAIQVEMTDALETSIVRLSYRRRFLSA